MVKQGRHPDLACASTYFADPWCWPQLWAENPQVTNPHWIFPGDVLRLRAGAAGARRAPAPARQRHAPHQQPQGLARQQACCCARRASSTQGAGRERRDHRLARREDHARHRRPGLRRASPRTGRCGPGERYSVFVADTQNPVRAPETGDDARVPGARLRRHRGRPDRRAEHGARDPAGSGRAGRARLRGQPARCACSSSIEPRPGRGQPGGAGRGLVLADHPAGGRELRGALARGQGRPGGRQPHLRGPSGRRLPPDHGGLGRSPTPASPRRWWPSCG